MALRIACDLDGTIADMDSALQREARRLFGPEVDLHAEAGVPIESPEDIEGQLAAADEEAASTAETDVNGPLRVASRVESRLSPAPLRPSDRPAAAPSVRADATSRALTNRELRQLWSHVGQTENFWTSLGEIEAGAVAQLASAATRHRWEVLFLTQRPKGAGETPQIQTQRWLQAHGFELPSVMVMQGSRGKVADALALDAVIDDRPENCLDVTTDSKAKALLVWRLRPELLPPGIGRTGIETVYSFGQALRRLEDLMEDRARGRTFLGRLRGALTGRK